jgi:hypothetical protein
MSAPQAASRLNRIRAYLSTTSTGHDPSPASRARSAYSSADTIFSSGVRG